MTLAYGKTSAINCNIVSLFENFGRKGHRGTFLQRRNYLQLIAFLDGKVKTTPLAYQGKPLLFPCFFGAIDCIFCEINCNKDEFCEINCNKLKMGRENLSFYRVIRPSTMFSQYLFFQTRVSIDSISRGLLGTVARFPLSKTFVLSLPKAIKKP